MLLFLLLLLLLSLDIHILLDDCVCEASFSLFFFSSQTHLLKTPQKPEREGERWGGGKVINKLLWRFGTKQRRGKKNAK